MSSRVELLIDGNRHGGWKSVDIRRSLNAVADHFDLSVTEKWSESSEPAPVRSGAECQVFINDELVITGYVDDALPAYDANQHSLVVSGRSKTADLVDCSSRRKTWSNPRKLEAIARELAEPFGIEVVVEADTGAPIKAPAVEAGQPFYEALEQMGRYRAVIFVCDPQGRLVITKPPRGRIDTALALGKNIRKGSGRFSVRDRFSQIIVQGQQPGDDLLSGEQAASPEGVSTDPVIRYRPQVIVADTAVDTAGCRQRAENETRRRRGRGRGLTYTVAGWRHEGGLWTPGFEVAVRDQWLGIEDDMIIDSVQLLLDGQGERAEIQVVPPSAWDLTAEPEPVKEQEGLW
ncbi:phage baseplate assembly protein [Marinobacter sp. OP 3.4]|uniref:phage baseplate assembly protein n=1 Tax=Marinobacter sp. OP 3.4 TaxID=3076501 RepID=UPI002E2139E5